MTSDPFSPDPASPTPPGRHWFRLAAVALGLAALGAVGGYVYYEVTAPDGGGRREVPLIRADEGPIKKRPEDPGGMAIPNQDKLVYEALRGIEGEERVEILLPPPEEPLPAPTPAEPDAAPEPPVEIATPEPEPEAPPAPEPAAEVAVVEPEPKAAPPTPAAKGIMIQLGAFRRAPLADAALRGILKNNRDLLGELNPKVLRADLGTRGVFFRVRAGPLGDAAEARALCARLKARRLACYIVGP